MPTCRNVGQLDSADSLYSGGNIFIIAMVIIYIVWPVERYWGVPESQLSQLLSIIIIFILIIMMMSMAVQLQDIGEYKCYNHYQLA